MAFAAASGEMRSAANILSLQENDVGPGSEIEDNDFFLPQSNDQRNNSLSNFSVNLGTPSRRPRTFFHTSGETFDVWPMTREERRCNDEVHSTIIIPPAVQVVLDTPPVQRLVHLKQLGCAYFAFSSCTHTRKEHCMGVMELAAKLANKLQNRQPQLSVSDKDVLCLRIAGLCHDLGHGPFSHMYETFLAKACEDERYHPEQVKDRDSAFRKKFKIEIPRLPDRWEHEEASLMMIDEVLASIGLEIDWQNLDEPLKQIGDGTDAKMFGLVLSSGEIEPFTSRDWIFIKECVFGGPLKYPNVPRNRPVAGFTGRGLEKEFLYDIVNNRHNGLDVDKIDYYARDSLAAHGSGQIDFVILEESVVAWGVCPNPLKCFKCKHTKNPGSHLMICYPRKLVSKAMDFFSTRMRNHREVYTHKKTKRAQLHIVDILLEADKHFCMSMSTQLNDQDALPTASRFRDFPYPRLPISRAWMNPRLYLRLDDSIINIIEDRAIEEEKPELQYLRSLINRLRKHQFYKCVGEAEVDSIGGSCWELSNEEITKELLGGRARYSGNLTLSPGDVIVEKREIHYGCKEFNPVSQMRFLSKIDCSLLSRPVESLPTAQQVNEEDYFSDIPRSFVRRTIRVFSRSFRKNEFISHVFHNWLLHKKDILDGPENSEYKIFEEEIDEDLEPTNPMCLTQDSDTCSASAPEKHDDGSTTHSLKRRRFDDSPGTSKRPVNLANRF